MNNVQYNPLCVEHDCSDCHGKGYVSLWAGNPPQPEEIPCPGKDSLKQIKETVKDNSNLMLIQDLDAVFGFELFKGGLYANV
jgi:hypothetical protein